MRLDAIGTAQEQCAWRRRDRQRAHGRVTGALSRHHRDPKVRDADARIDRALGRVEDALARQGRVRTAASRTRARGFFTGNVRKIRLRATSRFPLLQKSHGDRRWAAVSI